MTTAVEAPEIDPATAAQMSAVWAEEMAEVTRNAALTPEELQRLQTWIQTRMRTEDLLPILAAVYGCGRSERLDWDGEPEDEDTISTARNQWLFEVADRVSRAVDGV